MNNQSQGHSMTKHGISKAHYSTLLVSLTLLLSSCESSPSLHSGNNDLNQPAQTTAMWTDYCLGTHSMKLPPGFKAQPIEKFSFDHHRAHVIKNYAGSPADYLKAQPENGGVLHSTKIKDWHFYATQARQEGRKAGQYVTISNLFTVYGLQKIGNDLIVIRRNTAGDRISTEAPELRDIYKTLTVHQHSGNNQHKPKPGGICIGQYVLHGYTPKNTVEFRIKFEAKRPNPIHTGRLHLIIERWRDPGPGPTAKAGSKNEALIGFGQSVVNQDTLILSKQHYQASLTRDNRAKSFSAELYGDGGVETPDITITHFANDIVPLGDSEAQFVNFLRSIKPN